MRNAPVLVLACFTMAAACSQSRTRPTSCSVPSDCSGGDVCFEGTCVPGPADAGSDAGAPDAGESDAGGSDAGDAGEPMDAGAPDAGDAGADAGGPDAGIDGGIVGYGGGTVDLLDFVFTGDTRPGFCDLVGQYPTAIIEGEVAQMAAMPSQFAADLGDHMFACIPTLGSLTSTASQQMAIYVQAVSAYPKPWFMTMGNHECYTDGDCSSALSAATDTNFMAYMAALPTVSHQTQPYYSIDINTSLGLVRLVFIADNYASSDAQSWLESTMADADARAVHAIILKHHPYSGSDTGPSWMWATLAAHRVSLMLTAHEHDYSHDTTALDGRTVICGLGGANTSATGFCRVQQRADNSLVFTEYDLNSNPLDTWSVPAPPH